MELLAIAFCGAIALIFIFRASPRFAVVSWSLVLFFVPIWVGFSAGIFYSALTFTTLLCVASASLRGFRWTKVDTVVLLFAILITGSFIFGGVELGHLLIAGLDWIVPYVWGRIVLAKVGIEFITACISVLTVAAAALALVEFITGVNVFVLVHWDNSGYELWAPLQARGGFIRAEGAFGHSISLGASLSIGSVFVITTRWPLGIRIASLAIVGAAVIVTFSRIGLVGFALGIVLCLAFLGKLLSVRTRMMIAVIAIAGTIAVVPFISDVFATAGNEAEGSALYRLELLSLFSQMSPIGLSPGYNVLPNGEVYVGNFQSIDSALILMGLRLGYVPLALVMILLVIAVFVMFRSRANAPLIALVAGIPSLATVALITQMPYLLWFVAGLAVTLYILEKGTTQGTSASQVKALVSRGEWKANG